MNDRSFDSREFREALSTFATGVTIVTARDDAGERVGMTASSFNSVSMDPPLVLWSVTKTAKSAPAFRDAEHYCVHILSADQMDLSNLFARSGADKFAQIEDRSNAQNVPLIEGAACRFHCRQQAVHEGGDHWIIVGEVIAIDRENTEALVFGGGTYATAAPIRPKPNPEGPNAEDASPIDSLLFYHLSRAYHQMSDRFHHEVRVSGLSLQEWRILASLHGRAKRSFADLAARTFMDLKVLSDMMHAMRSTGLLEIHDEGGSIYVQGTQAGHDRVDHLVTFGQQEEKRALADAGPGARDRLLDLMRTIVANTDH